MNYLIFTELSLPNINVFATLVLLLIQLGMPDLTFQDFLSVDFPCPIPILVPSFGLNATFLWLTILFS